MRIQEAVKALFEGKKIAPEKLKDRTHHLGERDGVFFIIRSYPGTTPDISASLILDLNEDYVIVE